MSGTKGQEWLQKGQTSFVRHARPRDTREQGEYGSGVSGTKGQEWLQEGQTSFVPHARPRDTREQGE